MPSSNLQTIDLYWEGASDDFLIDKYEIYYSVGNSNVLSSTPIYVDHEVGKQFTNPYGATITNSYNTGAATYSHTVTSFAKHTFYIKTIDSIGQKSSAKVIVVDINNVILRSVVGIYDNNDSAACSIASVPSVPIEITFLDNQGNPTPAPLVGVFYQPDVNSTSRVTNISTNTPHNGDDQYWKVLIQNKLYSLLIDAQGYVLTSILCGVDTILNIGKVSNASSAGPSTSGNSVCNLTSLNTDVWFSGLLGINTILYTDSNLNNKLEGSNKWRIINYSTNGTDLNYLAVVRIGTGIDKGKVLDFQIFSTACPDVTYFCCFIGGTKILMSDYTYKNIEDVRVGDFVITFNEEKKNKEINKVLLKYAPIRSDLVKIYLEDNTEITSTVEHPFFVVNKGWSSYNKYLAKEYHSLDVSTLEIGDLLIRFDDKMLKVTNIELLDMSAKTYNFAVEGNNNYYANNVLVHNKYNSTNESQQEQISCVYEDTGTLTPMGG